jgi:hypothetical protein
MQYFAQITETVVIEVIVIADSDCNNLDFPASEPIGQTYIASLGLTGEWLQTSIDGSYRGVYAGIGYTYDVALDLFVAPPQPEPVPGPTPGA